MARRAQHITRLTDPASLPRAPKAPAIFDPRPHRNLGTPMALRRHDGRVILMLPGLPSVVVKDAPTDDRLIATQVACGMPRQAAEQVRHHGGARFLALRLWCDVQDAAEGDRAAKLRVDYHRQMFADLRRAELIADDPRRTVPLA